MSRKFDYQSLLGEGNPLLRYPQLLNAAIDEFSKKKFDDASLNDILKSSGMSKGSLYHHFGDKFGLYLALIDINLKKKLSYFMPLMQQMSSSGDFFGTMRLIIRGTIDFMMADDRMYHLSNRFLEVSPETRSKILTFFPYDYSKGFRPLIVSAIESGQIDNRYTPDFIVKILELFFTNTHKFLSPGDTTTEAEKIIDQMIEIIQYGILFKS